MNLDRNQDDAYNLRRIFEEMELELVRNLRRNLKRHENEEEKEGFRWEMWQRAKLRNLQKYRQENKKIVGEISPEVERAVNEALQSNYQKGQNLFQRIWKKIKSVFFQKKRLVLPKNISHHKRSTPPPQEKEFFGVNEKKLNVMRESVNHDLKEAQHAVLRRMDDVYRKTIYNAQMQMASGAKTLDQAIDMATKAFLEKGIDCIEYKNGRRVNIASYAEMCLRTASHRATLLGEGKKRDEWGIHTVVVSAHANTCPLCAPWQGKVLVDDVYCHGTREEAERLGYPLLSDAMETGLLHPNCRHTISTYFPGITKLPEVPDTEKAIETYHAEQKQRDLERKIRKWKRIAEGSLEPDKVKLAEDKVREYQRDMHVHLKDHPELRRDYNREKTRGIPEQLKSPITSTDKLTVEEEGAVIRYVSPDAYVLNDKLRRRAYSELTNAEKEWMRNLNSALNKMPRYEGDLNRSITFNFDEDAKSMFDQFTIGEKYTPDQYLSTTKTGMYNEEGQIQIFIQNAKNGHDLGEIGIEDEVLYSLNSKFKVLNKVEHGGKYYILLEEA